MGYGAIYKTKTREAMGTTGKVDGCAIFWRKSRIANLKMSNLELNEAAQLGYQREINHLERSFVQRMISQDEYDMHRQLCDQALKRVTRDNVAQVVVFQVTHSPTGEPLPAPVKFLVVNTHLFWDPAFEDVKLWQTVVLLEQVQLACRASEGPGQSPPPLLLFGDFNSEPASSVYKLLTKNSPTRSAEFAPSDYASFEKNGLQRILPVQQMRSSVESVLGHNLQLTSLFAAITGKEPEFTNLTRDYVGTLDYVWASHGSVRPLAALAIPSADELTGGKRHRLARKVDLGSAYGAGAFSTDSGAGGAGVVAGGSGGGGAGGGAAAGGGSPSLASAASGSAGGSPGSPGADETDGSEGLPNGAWPSDHLPLTFEVQLLSV